MPIIYNIDKKLLKVLLTYRIYTYIEYVNTRICNDYFLWASFTMYVFENVYKRISRASYR